MKEKRIKMEEGLNGNYYHGASPYTSNIVGRLLISCSKIHLNSNFFFPGNNTNIPVHYEAGVFGK